MRIKVVKNVELDMDAPTATDDELIDHEKDTNKKKTLYAHAVAFCLILKRMRCK